MEENDRHVGKYLGIYLRDHLAAAVAGLELAGRIHDREREGALGPELETLFEAISADRRTLEQVMEKLDVSASSVKNSAAWLSEKLGRIMKFNGRIVGRSPLAPVYELEGLAMGVRGKRALWESLKTSHVQSELSDFDFDELISRADAQMELIQELHGLVAEHAFSKEVEMEERTPVVGQRTPDIGS